MTAQIELAVVKQGNTVEKIFVEEVVKDLCTIQDMVRWAVSRFADASVFLGHGTDNCWDEAVSLVMQTLHLPPDMDASIQNARLTCSERQRLVELIIQRIQQRIPVPYLTQTAWFAGLQFYVDERVLIPRSPFAELIEQRFEAWLNGHEPQRILDMCTGSGCIAIALAYAFAEAEVDAVDLSPEALEVAEINIQRHGLENKVIPLQSDLFAAIEHEQYDLIVCNPPYVDSEDMANLPDEFRHEPELALAAGDDGLSLVKKLLREAASHLTTDGWLFVEVGNSMLHMQQQLADLPVEWIALENGGHGIFAINKATLQQHAAELEKFVG